MTLLTIKDLNLSDEKIQEIANKLEWSIEDVTECDDFHTENNALSMIQWIYDDVNSNDIISNLRNLSVINPQLSLFDNFLLHHANVFLIDENCYLFFYV